MISKHSLHAFGEELMKISKAPKPPRKFAGLQTMPPTREERGALNARLREAGLSHGSMALKKTKKGFAVHTHRARTSFYPIPAAIPLDKLRFISSTG